MVLATAAAPELEVTTEQRLSVGVLSLRCCESESLVFIREEAEALVIRSGTNVVDFCFQSAETITSSCPLAFRHSKKLIL